MNTEEIYLKPEYHVEIPGEITYKQIPGDAFKEDQCYNIVIEPGDVEDVTAPVTPQDFPEFGKVYENGKINRVPCPICASTFKNRANLKQHLRSVHCDSSSIVECEKCYRTFKSIVHLRSHIDSVHGETTEMPCDECGKVFLGKKKLNNHKYYTHPQPDEEVSCEICHKTFKKFYNLKIHTRQVHPVGEAAVCKYCNKVFKTDMLLQRHIKWNHSVDGMVYKCQHCGRMLPTIACYKKHIQNVHFSEEVACHLCDRVFKTSNILLRHVKTVHQDKKAVKIYVNTKISCLECDKKFNNHTSLFWHLERYHSNNKPDNYCHICAKEYSDNGALKRHLETVHSLETAACDQCGKIFKSTINLQSHIRITHAPPESAETCEICKKVYKCSLHLRLHKKAVHSDEGDIKCDVCNKAFTSKVYLQKHRKIHVESRNYPCNVCGKMFKTSLGMGKHKRMVHKIKNIDIPAPSFSMEDQFSYLHAKMDRDVPTISDRTISGAEMGECENELPILGDDMSYCEDLASGVGRSLSEDTPISQVMDASQSVCLKCDNVFTNDTELHAHILSCASNDEAKELPVLIVELDENLII